MSVETPSGAHQVRLARMLFSDLAATVDEAYGDVEGPYERLDLALDTAADSARAGELGFAAFEGIAHAEAARLERAFAVARTVAAKADLVVPEPEAFWAAGVDRIGISRGLHADATLIPVPAPHGLDPNKWMQLFRAAARASESPLSLTSPLALADDVQAAFAEFDKVPRSTPVVSSESRGTQEATRWTLRLIPATPAPTRSNLSHMFGPHPTLAEMLMLQLMLLEMGEDLVDRQSFTWLNGTFSDGRFAARHFFDGAQRSVGVNTREIGNQGPHLGVRPPIG